MTSTAAILSPRAYASTRQITWLFATTTFAASAFVLLVQPMSAKMLLPKLGGSAAVWNTCVLSSFNTSLLLGYLYAHVTTRWLGERRQAMAHLILMMAALAFLPLTLGDGSPPWRAPIPCGGCSSRCSRGWACHFLPSRQWRPWCSVGSRHCRCPQPANPYFLYSASNIGSMMALSGVPTHSRAVLGHAGPQRILVVGVWRAARADHRMHRVRQQER